MKMIKWIGHPVVVIVVYLLLIIEGDEFGGFFVLYLLLSLPHGAPYAMLAVIGIAAVVYAFNIYSNRYQLRKSFLYVFGLILMIVSLVLFFLKGNKWQTFQLGIPLGTFILFGICSICFVVRTLNDLTNYLESKQRCN